MAARRLLGPAGAPEPVVPVGVRKLGRAQIRLNQVIHEALTGPVAPNQDSDGNLTEPLLNSANVPRWDQSDAWRVFPMGPTSHLSRFAKSWRTIPASLLALSGFRQNSRGDVSVRTTT